jgi:hypothetical protein
MFDDSTERWLMKRRRVVFLTRWFALLVQPVALKPKRSSAELNSISSLATLLPYIKRMQSTVDALACVEMVVLDSPYFLQLNATPEQWIAYLPTTSKILLYSSDAERKAFLREGMS